MKPSHTCAPRRTHTLNVLIACEESQAECQAFRELGHRAFSCDIQPCRRGGHPEWHIQADVSPYLKNGVQFRTSDGKRHRIKRWHLIIAHPPCTYLCKVSSVWMRRGGKIDPKRHAKMLEGRRFFLRCLHAPVEHLAVENPLPMALANLPKPSCFIQPSWFGVKYTKKTLYWLKNLPPILPTIEHPNPREYVRASRGKYRSRTFPEVAQAIALQWSNYILDEINSTESR